MRLLDHAESLIEPAHEKQDSVARSSTRRTLPASSARARAFAANVSSHRASHVRARARISHAQESLVPSTTARLLSRSKSSFACPTRVLLASASWESCEMMMAASVVSAGTKSGSNRNTSSICFLATSRSPPFSYSPEARRNRFHGSLEAGLALACLLAALRTPFQRRRSICSAARSCSFSNCVPSNSKRSLQASAPVSASIKRVRRRLCPRHGEARRRSDSAHAVRAQYGEGLSVHWN